MSEPIVCRSAEELAHALEQARLARKLSMSAVGKLCNLAQSQIAAFETRHHPPLIYSAQRWAAGLGYELQLVLVPKTESTQEQTATRMPQNRATTATGTR